MEKLWYAKGTVEREEFKRQYRQQPACRRFAKEKSTRVRVLEKRSEIASLRQSSENTRERCTTRVESKRPRHGEKVAPRRILRSGFTAHTLHYIGGRGVHGRGTRRHCTAVKCILSLAHLWPLSGSQCARSWYLLFSRCNVASTSDYFPPLSSTSHPGIFRRDRLFFLSSLSLFFFVSFCRVLSQITAPRRAHVKLVVHFYGNRGSPFPRPGSESVIESPVTLFEIARIFPSRWDSPHPFLFASGLSRFPTLRVLRVYFSCLWLFSARRISQFLLNFAYDQFNFSSISA